MSGPLVCRCRVQPPSLEAAGQSHSARLLPFSPLSFPRKQESSAPKPVTRPWIDGNREDGEPKCDCPGLQGVEGEKSKTAGNSPEICPRHSPGPEEIRVFLAVPAPFRVRGFGGPVVHL